MAIIAWFCQVLVLTTIYYIRSFLFSGHDYFEELEEPEELKEWGTPNWIFQGLQKVKIRFAWVLFIQHTINSFMHVSESRVFAEYCFIKEVI